MHPSKDPSGFLKHQEGEWGVGRSSCRKAVGTSVKDDAGGESGGDCGGADRESPGALPTGRR